MKIKQAIRQFLRTTATSLCNGYSTARDVYERNFRCKSKIAEAKDFAVLVIDEFVTSVDEQLVSHPISGELHKVRTKDLGNGYRVVLTKPSQYLKAGTPLSGTKVNSAHFELFKDDHLVLNIACKSYPNGNMPSSEWDFRREKSNVTFCL